MLEFKRKSSQDGESCKSICLESKADRSSGEPCNLSWPGVRPLAPYSAWEGGCRERAGRLRMREIAHIKGSTLRERKQRSDVVPTQTYTDSERKGTVSH